MAYDPSNYINGVDQRTERQKIRDEKESEAKRKADLKEGMRGRILGRKPESPSPLDIQTGHFRTTKYTKPVN